MSAASAEARASRSAARGSTGGARPALPGRPLDACFAAVLVVLAVSPMSAAFLDAGFWIAVTAGALLGSGIAVLGTLRRWRALSVASVVVFAYFAAGAAVVFRDRALGGVVPTLDVLVGLALSVVRVWKQMLTLPAPFVGAPELAAGPFIATLVTAVLAVSVTLRSRRAAAALIPTGLLLVLATAFSTYLGFFPAISGAVFATVAVGWLAWRGHRAAREQMRAFAHEEGVRAEPVRLVSGLSAAALIAVAAVGGGVTAQLTAQERNVLRDHVVPPLEMHDYASPLMDFRRLVRDGKDVVLFTVTGLPDGSPVRLASLDLYDGIVYKVSGSGGAGAGVFTRVGRQITNRAEGDPIPVSVRIDKLTGVWVPTVGSLDSLRVVEADASGSQGSPEALHYNATTGTAMTTVGIREGETYSMDAVIPAAPDPEALAHASISAVALPAPEQTPDALQAALDGVDLEGLGPYDQVKAVEAHFRAGSFSHGLVNQTPSRSGHGVGRLDQFLGAQELIGDDEQYAVSMALALSRIGIPSRVVMGFTPAEPNATAAPDAAVTVTGDDLHAWVEVPFEGLGWISFTPTPPETNVPKQQAPEPRQKPRVQVAQPPDIPQEPAELPPPPPVEATEDGDKPLDLGWLWATLRIVGLSLLAIIVLAGPPVVLAVLRSRRRARREQAPGTVARVDGGWAELVDEAGDVGLAVPAGATRREQGAVLEERMPEPGARSLAVRADAAVFGDMPPTEADAAQYWADMDAARRLIVRAVPWHRRLAARLFPRSVLSAVPWARLAAVPGALLVPVTTAVCGRLDRMRTERAERTARKGLGSAGSSAASRGGAREERR